MFLVPLRLLCGLLCVTASARGGATLLGTPVRKSDAIGRSIKDVRGRVIALPDNPRRIVSLNPGATELLFAAGAGTLVVGCTSYCDYPPEVRRIAKVGDVTTSIEKVLAQKPDIVIAGLTANGNAITVLERLHVTVFVIEPNTIASIADNIELLGRVAGTERLAGLAAQKLRQEVSRLQSDAKRQTNHPGVIWLVQNTPIIAVGGGNFMDDAIRLAGGKNIVASQGTGWISLTQDRIMILGPNVLITDRNSIESIRSKPLWANVPAIRSGSVFAITAGESARPSPRVVAAIEQLSGLLRRASAKSP